MGAEMDIMGPAHLILHKLLRLVQAHLAGGERFVNRCQGQAAQGVSTSAISLYQVQHLLFHPTCQRECCGTHSDFGTSLYDSLRGSLI